MFHSPGQRSILPRQFSADGDRVYPLTSPPTSARETSSSSAVERHVVSTEKNDDDNNRVPQVTHAVQQAESNEGSKNAIVNEEVHHHLNAPATTKERFFNQDVAPPFYAGTKTLPKFKF